MPAAHYAVTNLPPWLHARHATERATQRFARSTLGFALVTFTARVMDVRFFDATDGRAREIYGCRAAVDVPGCIPQ